MSCVAENQLYRSKLILFYLFIYSFCVCVFQAVRLFISAFMLDILICLSVGIDWVRSITMPTYGWGAPSRQSLHTI